MSPTSLVRTPHRSQDYRPDTRVKSERQNDSENHGEQGQGGPPSLQKRSSRGGAEERKKPQHHSVILGNVHSGLMHETAMNRGSHVDGVYGNMPL